MRCTKLLRQIIDKLSRHEQPHVTVFQVEKHLLPQFTCAINGHCWYNFNEVIRVRIKWKAFVERYIYNTREEQRQHRTEMLKKGYEDTGLSSAVIEENGKCRSTYAGEYRKYSYRK